MDLEPILVFATSAIGFYSLATSIVRFFRWVWVTIFRQPKDLTHYGSWAIITGSTGGIGKAMALELASKGLNLLLIDRKASDLQHLRNAIREKFGSKVNVKYLVMDFLEHKNVDIVKKIEEATKGLDIGVLFNNAGVNTPNLDYIHEVDSRSTDSMIGVNLDGLTWMTKAVLPVMLKKKKGCIVNMGSGSATLPSFPLCTLYTATKAYVRRFSKSISLEYGRDGIDIQCQEPMFINTKLIPMTRASFFVPSPEMHSKVAIRFIGYEHQCVPYWTHCLQWWVQSVVPDELLSGIYFRFLRSVRKSGVVRVFGFDL